MIPAQITFKRKDGTVIYSCAIALNDNRLGQLNIEFKHADGVTSFQRISFEDYIVGDYSVIIDVWK
jgi:hypothetical protein